MLSVLTVQASARTWGLTRIQDLSQHRRSSWPIASAPWQHSRGFTVSSVSQIGASHGDADFEGSPSAPEDGDNFGTFSTDMSSRRSYRKNSPDIQDLRHQEDDGVEEEESVKPPRRPGRNTPYWYFLQCKQLIKNNKVSVDQLSRFCLLLTTLNVFCLTAAGGFGSVQQRHAAGGEAAAGGVQLHGPDRRLWSSWAAQKGLQTVQ